VSGGCRPDSVTAVLTTILAVLALLLFALAGVLFLLEPFRNIPLALVSFGLAVLVIASGVGPF
jgi:hypothetical protein